MVLLAANTADRMAATMIRSLVVAAAAVLSAANTAGQAVVDWAPVMPARAPFPSVPEESAVPGRPGLPPLNNSTAQ